MGWASIALEYPLAVEPLTHYVVEQLNSAAWFSRWSDRWDRPCCPPYQLHEYDTLQCLGLGLYWELWWDEKCTGLEANQVSSDAAADRRIHDHLIIKRDERIIWKYLKPNCLVLLRGQIKCRSKEVHEARQVPKLSRQFGNLDNDVNPFLFVNSASHDQGIPSMITCLPTINQMPILDITRWC